MVAGLAEALGTAEEGSEAGMGAAAQAAALEMAAMGKAAADWAVAGLEAALETVGEGSEAGMGVAALERVAAAQAAAVEMEAAGTAAAAAVEQWRTGLARMRIRKTRTEAHTGSLRTSERCAPPCSKRLERSACT